jgi:hypothetical protein
VTKALPLVLILALSACASAPAPDQAAKGPAEPSWVRSWDEHYGSAYISAVGYGESREGAEKSALAALASRFELSVQTDTRIVEAYQEAVKDGVISASSDTTINNAIKTSASIENLIGAEIRDIWDDGKLYYASALMDRQKTIALYTGIIKANLESIEKLTNIKESDKYTLGSLARYNLASVIAEANQVYLHLLSVAGAGNSFPDLKNGLAYSLEAENIRKTITIALRVSGDRENRITGAFQKILNQQGFETAAAAPNNRYVLTVTALFSESPVDNPRYKYVDWAVNAQLTDTAASSVLLPFAISGREGHLNVEGAEQRAVQSAEKTIIETYGEQLTRWLTSP